MPKTKRPKAALQWSRWPRREHTPAGYKRTWTTRCGRYRVEEMTPLGGLSRCYYALVLEEDQGYRQWTFVDPLQRRYRSRQAAIRACLRHVRWIGVKNC